MALAFDPIAVLERKGCRAMEDTAESVGWAGTFWKGGKIVAKLKRHCASKAS